MATKLKRLLAVSWALPPLLTPRSLQVGRLLNALAEIGWSIDVIGVEPKSTVNVKQFDYSVEAKYTRLLRTYRVAEPKSMLLALGVAKLFPALQPLPDAARAWAKKATRLGRELLRSNQYYAMMTFGQPWSSHIVGLGLKQIFDLPWLAHFSDPWADNPYNQKLNAKQQTIMMSLEREVVAAADQLIFTNVFAANKLMSKYPKGWASKVEIIPHAFDNKSIVQTARPVRSNNQMSLVYTGNLYGLRTPRNLILAISKLSRSAKVCLEIVGVVKEVEAYRRLANENGVGHLVKFTGHLPYQASLKLAMEADVLVLIDAPSSESLFLPSKLIDYLMFDKTILGITPLEGAAAELLYLLDYPVVAPEDVEGITNALRQLSSRWQSGQLKASPKHKETSKRYEIGQVAQEFDRALNSA